MEYLLFFAVVAVVAAAVFINGAISERKNKQRRIQKLWENYGHYVPKKYTDEQLSSKNGYFEHHKTPEALDEITWQDLAMEEVYKRVDATLSSAGEEVLYDRLRKPLSAEEEKELLHLEADVCFFLKNPEIRLKVQTELLDLRYRKKFSLYDYLDYLDNLGERKNFKHLLAILLYLPCIGLCFFSTAGVLALVLLMLYQILTYFKEKNEIDPYIASFAYIMRLVKAGEALAAIRELEELPEKKKLESNLKALRPLKRGMFWLMASGRMSGSGNPLDILLDYVRMILHLDLLKFNQMLSTIRKCIAQADGLFYVIGYLDMAQAVGSLRLSLTEGYAIPVLEKEGRAFLRMEEGYHPLLEHPVKNSIQTTKNILLTGSNASGKSTFLKTVAVNAILAQTIHTVCADAYRAGYFAIFSSMALKDDLFNGESYFVVEIRSLKRIIDRAARGEKVLCFVDEVLRGTGTVERIAASTEILKSLYRENVCCFAATHDIELTQLLTAYYDNVHFEEEIVDGDIRFPYRLLPGKATTKNAIRLLEVMGYEKELVDKARLRAEIFLQTGNWTE